MNKVIFLIFIFLIQTAGIYSQQVWPVQVTGSIIPPHSLDLKVYGNDRSTDLNFQVLLNDPEELALQVIPILTIEQNGNVIYQTDMNYSANPITLNQFTSYLLDGAALNQYLSAEALSGNNGIGKGATLIPEGFNQICLQMYGVDRTVPVSNKFCVSGNFRLNQAPQLIKPSFNDIIKMPPVQNMIFSWMPMHLSSGNNPGAVEYVFELVELPIGVMNANDVFESALKIYSTTVMSTSFIYSQSEPVLNPNTYYAWRVTAKSILYPTSLLFQNEGKSEISMFMMYDGDAPSTELNPFDNPAPRGCSVYETSYGPIAKADNESMILGANQEVKLGYFKMKITEAIGDIQNGYSGKGIVYYPMLRSSLEVEFKNIRVNKEGRVYESEKISSKINNELNIPFELINKDNVKNYITQDYTSKVYQQINDQSIVSKLSESNIKINSLPLALSNSNFSNELACVIGVNFTPTNAYLNLVSRNKNGDIYAATGIPSTPYGMKSDAYMVPIAQNSKNGSVTKLLETIEIAPSLDDDSKITCDCNGYKEVRQKNVLQIAPSIIVRADNGNPVVLDIKDHSGDNATYFGEISKLPEFQIKGLDQFNFNSKKILIDLSENNALESAAKYTEKDNEVTKLTWKGIALLDASVEIPKSYNLLNANESLILDKGEILINKNEIVYGSFAKENLISIKSGKVENWRYSVDKYAVEINKGKVGGATISGKLKLPIADNLINYKGELFKEGNENPKMNIDIPKENMNIEMWAAKMDLSQESSFGLELKQLGNEKLMYPSANLTGDLNIDIKHSLLEDKLKGNAAQKLSDIKQVLDLKGDDLSFSISKLKINNWNLTPYEAPENKYKVSSVDEQNAGFIIGDKTFPVTHSEVLKGENDRMGLSVVISKGNNKINFIIWGAQKDGEFELDEIEAKIIDLKCDCTVEPGGIGKVELEKLYDKMIKEAYDEIAYNKPKSGMQSVDNDLEFKQFYNQKKLELLLNTTEGGWIVKDGKVYVPFLDMNIEVSQVGNKLTSVRHDIDSSLINRNIYANKKRPEHLPMVVDNDLFTKLGFKTNYNIPENSRLIISELTIPDINKPKGTMTFNLVSYVKKRGIIEEDFDLKLFGNQNLLFESKPINISNDPKTGVNLANMELKLMMDFKSVNSDSRENEYEFKKSLTINSSERFSKARMDCTKGFQNFDMVGYFKPKNLVPVGEEELHMAFTLNTALNNNTHDLGSFIGVISDENSKGEKWKFHIYNQPHIVFSAGKNYTIYLDLSPKLKTPNNHISKNFTSVNNESFEGLVFLKFQAELPMFDISNKPLYLAAKDAMYLVGDESRRPSFSINLTSTNVIQKSEGANFSGWKITVDLIDFKINSNRFVENLTYSGSMLLPIFKDEPKNYEDRTFDSGWAKFRGSVIADNGNMTSTINFNNLNDKLFQSVLNPGMSIKLDSNSRVAVEYNQSTKKWIPTAIFSGICDFYLNKNVSASLNITALPGSGIKSDKMSFENLTVSTISKNSSLKFKLEGDQISYIDLGKWGEVDTKALGKLEAVQDFETRVNTVNGQKPSAGSSKAMPGGKEGSKSQFLGFDLSTTWNGPRQRNGELVMELKLSVGLMGSTKEKTKDGTETKSQYIRTEGVLGLVYKPSSNSQDTWEFNSVTVECLAVEGAIGPVSFSGGLRILRDDEEYGSGLKGYLSADIAKFGGLTIVGQFGLKKEGNDEYPYGFLDLEVFSEQGIPLFYDPVSNLPKVDFFGAGGGIAINMRTKKALDSLSMPSKDDMAKKDADKKKAEERKNAIEKAKDSNNEQGSKSLCDGVGGELLQPGIGLNQHYTPDEGTFGGKIFIIFGPHTPVKPPYTLVADAGIRIEMKWHKETNELSLGEMAIEARGYLMPSSIRERRDNNVGDAYAGITLDWRNKILDGEIAFRSKFEIPLVKHLIFSLPVNYDKTVFASRENYNKGRLRFGFSPSNPYAELKLGGPGTGELKPISGKFMTRPFPLTYTTVEAYAQVGANVDAPRKMEDMVPELRDILKEADKKEREEILKKERTTPVNLGSGPSKGIAFGLVMTQDVNANFLLLHGDLKVKLGLDVNLREYNNVTCTNSKNQGKIGLEGWYAKGSAFAYVKGGIDIGFRLFGVNMTKNVFNTSAYLTMQAEGPNPSYFRGMIGGQYNVLDGAYKGDFQYKVIIGEQCEYTAPPDPLADITIFKNASVINHQENVDRYSDIKLKTNIPLRKDYTLTQKDGKDNTTNAITFSADLKSITVKTMGNRVRNLNRTTGGNTVTLSFDEALEPLTEYTIEYEFVWLVRENNIWVDRNKPEKGSITFKTGKRPTNIMAGMIEYSAPGIRQRYWHKGYADTEIKFKRKALDDAKTLFPQYCEECKISGPSGPVKIEYGYIARVTDKNGKSTDFDITGYPGLGETVKIYTAKTKSIDGRYHIPYMEERSVDVSKVTFPGLKNFNVEKGQIYKLEIIRGVKNSVLSLLGSNGNNIWNKILNDNTFVLQTTYFGTSLYDNLRDKLQSVDKVVHPPHIRSDVKMRDFSHPSDIYDSERISVINQLGESKFHSVRDDYYAVEIKNRKGTETFDKYDIMRMKRNLKLEYYHDYIPALHVTQYHQNKGMNDQLAAVLNTSANNLAGKSYLKKVLFDHAKVDEYRKLDYGSDKISDGTKWHYRITGPTDPDFNELTDAEIQNMKFASRYADGILSKDIPGLAGKFVQGDVLIQDLRSRIVINQMFWLSKIKALFYDASGGSGAIEFNSIRRKGQFLDDGGSTDFSWITKPPSGNFSLYSEVEGGGYISSEPGYRLSYHGHSKMSFPDGDFGEMIESKRDKNMPMKPCWNFKPDRKSVYPLHVTDVNELTTNEWYEIKYRDNYVWAQHPKIDWITFFNWGLILPKGGQTVGAQYYLFNSAQGLLQGRKFNDAESPVDENRWNFVNEGGGISIINDKFKNRDDKFDKWWPYNITRYWDEARLNKDHFRENSNANNVSTLQEINVNYFNPSSKYRIHTTESIHQHLRMSDNAAHWRIIKDGKFYRIECTTGDRIYGHYNEDGDNGRKYRWENVSRALDRNNLDDYYRRVWNIIKVPGGAANEYIIQNVFYINHFLEPRIMNDDQIFLSGKPIRLFIDEITN